jgi:CDP-diacylglycerol--serine O-phosphatidyltransferase
MMPTEPEAQVQAKKPRRGIYLLPNLFTTAGMFAGFYAIVAATGGRFTAASVAVLIALLLDGVDGRVARMTNTQSDFGAQYDSLADLISFGLAPALVMFEWSLSSMVELGGQWGRLGWLAAFFYVAMAALRLARFNVQIGTVDKRYFSGLASPSAATLMVSFIWLCDDAGIHGTDAGMWIFALVLTLFAGALMVSPILYYSFKEIGKGEKIPQIGMLIVVLVIMLITIDPPIVIFLGFLIYALSGPVQRLMRRYRKKQRIKDEDESGAAS